MLGLLSARMRGDSTICTRCNLSRNRVTVRSMHSWLPHLALHVCALLWGTQHAIIKSLVVSSALPVVINAIRFTIAAAVTSLASCLVAACRWRCGPSDPGSDARRDGVVALGRDGPPSLWPVAAELALWQSLGFTLQLVGLHWATATRSAVVLYLNAFLVPLIAKLLDRRTVALYEWLLGPSAGLLCVRL